MIITSSAEMNSACGEVFAGAKTLGRRKSADAWRTGRLLRMPNGIIIIDKPRDWTSMDVCIPQTHASAGTL